jgi:hypothetical protein
MSQFTFTATFDKLEDLAAFVVNIGGAANKAAAATVDVAPAAAPIESKLVRSRSSKKAEEKPELHANPPAEPVPVEVIAAPKVVEVQAPAAVVQAQVVAPAVDKQAMIGKVRLIVNDMKAKGKNDDDIKVLFAQIYSQLGLPTGVIVSQLNEDQVTRFLFALEQNATPAPASFI